MMKVCLSTTTVFKPLSLQNVSFTLPSIDLGFTTLYVLPRFPMASCYNTLQLVSVDAAYQFYRIHREEKSLKRRGKNDDKQKRKRPHERQLRVSYLLVEAWGVDFRLAL